MPTEFINDIFGSSPQGKRAICTICHKRKASNQSIVPICRSCDETAAYLDSERDRSYFESRAHEPHQFERADGP